MCFLYNGKIYCTHTFKIKTENDILHLKKTLKKNSDEQILNSKIIQTKLSEEFVNFFAELPWHGPY